MYRLLFVLRWCWSIQSAEHLVVEEESFSSRIWPDRDLRSTKWRWRYSGFEEWRHWHWKFLFWVSTSRSLCTFRPERKRADRERCWRSRRTGTRRLSTRKRRSRWKRLWSLTDECFLRLSLSTGSGSKPLETLGKLRDMKVTSRLSIRKCRRRRCVRRSS